MNVGIRVLFVTFPLHEQVLLPFPRTGRNHLTSGQTQLEGHRQSLSCPDNLGMENAGALAFPCYTFERKSHVSLTFQQHV